MARQTGEIILVGTIDDITFYQMEGKGYARKKSSLTGKRVKKDPRFKRTMESAERLARGSQLASKVYRSLAREKQVYGMFCTLKSAAIKALKEGRSEEVVIEMLRQLVGKERNPVTPLVKEKKALAIRTAPSFTKKLFRVRGGRRKRGLGNGRRRCKLAPVLRE